MAASGGEWDATWPGVEEKPMEAEHETPTESPEARRRLASSFDSLVESNLKLTSAVDGLVGVLQSQMRYQTIAVGLMAVMFALAMLR
jgi:hypothetical protein